MQDPEDSQHLEGQDPGPQHQYGAHFHFRDSPITLCKVCALPQNLSSLSVQNCVCEGGSKNWTAIFEGRFEGLLRLEIEDCFLPVQILGVWGSCFHSLEELRVENCRIDNRMLREVRQGSFRKLKRLFLGRNCLTFARDIRSLSYEDEQFIKFFLKFQQLIQLNLDNNILGQLAVFFLFMNLSHLDNLSIKIPELKKISFSLNGFQQSKHYFKVQKILTLGERRLTQLINCCETIEQLEIENDLIGYPGAIEIGERLTQLKCLNLNNNNIGVQGAIFLSQKLTQLQALKLSKNNLGDEAAIAVSKGFRFLATLHLNSNNITTEGAIHMARNINPGSIRSLELYSNKICYQGLLALCCKLSSSLKNLRIGKNGLKKELIQKYQQFFKQTVIYV